MHLVRYGAHEIPLMPALDGRADVTRILPSEVETDDPASALVQSALERPTGSARLRELARGARSAVVLVPGIDRIASVGDFAMPLLRELKEAGLPRAKVRFCLATGTHEHRGLLDLHALIGPEVAVSALGYVHDCRAGDFIDLGVTSRGTRVQFARTVVEADIVVLTGRAVPHYFAGFGGGRKALLPGVASFATISQNHRLTLANRLGVASGVGPCALANNPVHLDMVEASRLAKPAFALTTVLDAQHRVVGVFAGHAEASHEQACAFARRVHEVLVEKPFDAVITSAGGAPYDMNFMQSLKALFNVQEGIAAKGPILWIAECSLGVAKSFLDWAAVDDDETLERQVRGAYNLAGHNSIMLRHLLRKSEIGLVTSMPADCVRKLGLSPLNSLEAGLSWLRERVRPGARVAYVPFGNVTHLGLMQSQGES